MSDQAEAFTNIHATCVSINGCGILLKGPSGSGKSSVALRMIDQPGFGLVENTSLNTSLVADDQVNICTSAADTVLASAPDNLKGLLEVRGVGILKIPHLECAPLGMIVNLMSSEKIERMPEAENLHELMFGISVPAISVDGFSPAAPSIIRAAYCHFCA